MRSTMSRPVGHTGKQHWPHGLSCHLAGLPPMLITGLGNWFFNFSIFRTFKAKKLQCRFQSKRNQPRFRAVKLYEVRAVLPPIPASFLPPDNWPSRRVVHPLIAHVPPADIRPAPVIKAAKRRQQAALCRSNNQKSAHKKPYTLVSSC